MGNGTQMTLEMWMPEACPVQNAGVSGRPVRISLLQAGGKGLEGTEASLYGKFLDCWKNKKKKADPNGLSMKTLRECFLATGDSTICQSSLNWTGSGMILNGRISTVHGSSHRTGSGYTLLDILEEEVPEKYFLSKEQMEKIIFR